MRFFLGVLLPLLSVNIALAQPGDDSKRLPVPGQKDLARSEALIKDIFGDDIAKAKSPEAKSRLASMLLQQGDESKIDAADRYVLYQHARTLGAQAGDATLALSAAEKLARYFDVNAVELKTATLATIVEHTETPEGGKALVELLLPLIGEAVDADNYESALHLCDLAEKAAKKARSIPLVNSVRERQQEVLAVQKGFSRLEPFVKRLQKNAKDPEANLELGKYFGLLKGKWERALPLLAMGNDEALKAQARRDLGRPKVAAEQLAVADGWWDLAVDEKDPAKLNLQRRAMFWYEQALPELRGLSRLKASKRIDQIAGRVVASPVDGPIGKIGELRRFDGHTDEIRSVAFSQDGRYAVSGGLDLTVRVWDLQGKEEFILRGHTKQIWTVAFHPNNRQVFSASWDATARLWDVKSGQEGKRYTHGKDVNGLAVSRDGSMLLTGCDDGSAYLWRVANGEEMKRYPGFSNYVYGVAFAANGRYIAAGSNDKSLKVFDFNTATVKRAFENHSDAITVVAFSPLDSRYVFACGDSAAHQYDIETGKEIRRYEGKTGRVLALAVSPDGRRLLTAGEDKIIHLWDLTNGKELQKFEGHSDTINSVAFSANGRQMLSAGMDRTVRLWGLPR